MSDPPVFSQRADIRMGYRCNARCGFCYYQDSLDNPVDEEPTTSELRRRLSTLRALGATEVEFTGGEPTIRPDLASLIASARTLGFVNISVISNGLRLAKPAYAHTLIEAGANDFLFSIHGHSSVLHDAHTGIPGSFDRILAAIENVKAAGARCRSSSTVTGMNYAHVGALVGKVIELDVDCIHLTVFSPVTEARRTDPAMFVRYSDAADAIKRAIDRHADRLPPLSVKYLPFCFMQGYEKYVMNLYQQSFDPDEWNYYWSNEIRRARSRFMRLAFDAASLAGCLLAKNRHAALAYGVEGSKVHGFTRLVQLLRKKRVSACKSCRYRLVCDYAWKDYVRMFGDAEFVPVLGDAIVDPAWCYELARYRPPGVRVGRRALRNVGAVDRTALKDPHESGQAG